MSLYSLIPKLLFLAVVIILIFQIFQRWHEKKKEDFEDRDN